jgi:malate synthase
MRVPAYLDYLPAPLRARLAADADPVPAVPGLSVARGLRASFPTIETDEALEVVVEVYRTIAAPLSAVLEQRKVDRAFVDDVTASLVAPNARVAYTDPAFQTVIGAKDASGRVVVGPITAAPEDSRPAPITAAPPPLMTVDIPPALAGEQITLFGPPDTARMSINAMNALHRARPGEPPIVAELVAASGQVPRWGADDEDSKTPIMQSFLRACENLIGCFDGTLRFVDAARDRVYSLAETGRARPIKRVPGLAIPDGSHLLDGEPLPLHLIDLVLHVWHNRTRPEALAIYFPKLENEEEAVYLATLIRETEAAVQRRYPAYQAGSVRVLVVFENPRAIFRIREIAVALHPYFLGGSLGWHDFLASTARLFKNDPHYRIPVKADPNIVINNIRESHRILVRDLGPIGAMKLGGMYGVLFEEDDPASFQVTMVGFLRDVVTQLRRGLDGFWVAHPDFVRIGVALVEAWRRFERDASDAALPALVAALVSDPVEQAPLLRFILGGDAPGLAADDPMYLRGVLAANLNTSDVVANDDPTEVRYNVFQALQYLADWLSGNGCVALPATLKNARGERVAVRIMDDLATTERSRWELWAEVHHQRVSPAAFDAILDEEVAFLRADRDQPEHRIHVRWRGEAARWYPIAARLLRQLVLAETPHEFVTELALPFTFPAVRDAADPWAAAVALCPGKFNPAV